jgi:replicative DNA helicase
MATCNELLTERVPPHSLEAERAVLGSILLEGSGAIARLGGLTETDFYAEKHRTVFAAEMRLAVVGEPIGALTLAHEPARSCASRGSRPGARARSSA